MRDAVIIFCTREGGGGEGKHRLGGELYLARTVKEKGKVFSPEGKKGR